MLTLLVLIKVNGSAELLQKVEISIPILNVSDQDSDSSDSDISDNDPESDIDILLFITVLHAHAEFLNMYNVIYWKEHETRTWYSIKQ